MLGFGGRQHSVDEEGVVRRGRLVQVEGAARGKAWGQKLRLSDNVSMQPEDKA